jgi:hypothetical protein
LSQKNGFRVTLSRLLDWMEPEVANEHQRGRCETSRRDARCAIPLIWSPPFKPCEDRRADTGQHEHHRSVTSSIRSK